MGPSFRNDEPRRHGRGPGVQAQQMTDVAFETSIASIQIQIGPGHSAYRRHADVAKTER